jgi:hypothetical protein
MIVLCVLFALIFFSFNSKPKGNQPALANNPSSEPNSLGSNLPQATEVQSVPTASLNAPLARTAEPMSIDASSFLSEYQANEEAANTRYEGRKVTMTGVLSGVFIPPPGTPLPADAFVTMGGPLIVTPSDALVLPGVTAYSVEDGSFFGMDSSNPLQVGRTVTLVCTCGKGHPAIAQSGYAVMLTDCLFRGSGNGIATGEHYSNKRYGFSMDIPTGFHEEESRHPEENGDGIVFDSADDGASFGLYGSNTSGSSLDDIHDEVTRRLHDSHIDAAYYRAGTDWFVMSWTDESVEPVSLVYQKTFVGKGSENTFIFTYPASKRTFYAGEVARMERSFSPGDIEESH